MATLKTVSPRAVVLPARVTTNSRSVLAEATNSSFPSVAGDASAEESSTFSRMFLRDARKLTPVDLTCTVNVMFSPALALCANVLATSIVFKTSTM